LKACNKDCVLSEWMEWNSQCSKPCGGGKQVRVKNLLKPAVGAGKCPRFHDDFRYGAKPCETQKCPGGTEKMICEQKKDVILLIDGSGSLGIWGWEQVRLASLSFVESMAGQVNLGVLLFSGPVRSEPFQWCTGQIKEYFGNGTEYSQEHDCGMQWIQRLPAAATGSNFTAIAEEVQGMAWPQGATFTSMALNQAAQELGRGGRDDTSGVVVVLTDGLPYSKEYTTVEAMGLQEKGIQVVWVPVGPGASKEASIFAEWASYPVDDNIVVVPDLTKLDKTSTINDIVADICIKVEYLSGVTFPTDERRDS
jgi:hypothetical protein